MKKPQGSAGHYVGCFGCGSQNQQSLGLRWKISANLVEAKVTLRRGLDGPPGFAHGGIVSAVLDDAMGIMAQQIHFPSPTVRLEVQFIKPVPLEVPLFVSSAVESSAPEVIVIQGELKTGGTVLARGRGHYRPLDVPEDIESFVQRSNMVQ